jgi:hypothetical protein
MTHVSPAAARRTLALPLLTAAAVVLLSGCFKLDMQMQLQPDDTVARNQAALLGGEDALRESLQNSEAGVLSETPSEGSFEQRDYEDSDWIGTESVFSDVPIDQFGEGDTGDLSITREGDQFVVAGTMDLTGEQPDASTQAILDTAELQIAITFPGAVSESNGSVDGTTVTWEPKPGEVLEISATGSAVAGVNWTLIVAVAALVALVVVGIVLFVAVRRRETARAAADPLPRYDPDVPPDGSPEQTV